MIIVTGANGKLGHGIVNNLLERIPAEKIGVSVRDTSKERNRIQDSQTMQQQRQYLKNLE